MTEDHPKRAWTGQEAGRYEAALEAINGAIGTYSAHIAREEAKPEPKQLHMTAFADLAPLRARDLRVPRPQRDGSRARHVSAVGCRRDFSWVLGAQVG